MPGPDERPPKFFEDVSHILNQIIEQDVEKHSDEKQKEPIKKVNY